MTAARPRTIQQLFDLRGKTALVTGGSRGLGLQLAQALGEAGAKLILSSRKAEDLVAATAELKSQGLDVDWIAADCSKDKVMNLNVRGYFILSQHIAKHSMIARRTGRIINLASIAGLGGNPKGMNTVAYNTSKGAVINFTRALACEWGQYNITVNAICPGFFPSRMTMGTLKAMGEETLAAHAPLGRLGDDEDLKGLCVLYASDAGKHITGQWLAVDGGVSVVTGG
jgi:gluconate 5-dehydrogenase